MQELLSINWFAIVLATVASMALGMAWYSTLGNQWMAALGKTREDLMPDGKASSKPFIIAGVAQVIMAFVLLTLVRKVFDTSAVDVQVADAVLLGAQIWFGFMLTSMLLNHAYQGQKLSLSIIDGGYLLGIMLLQGCVLGLIA